VTFAIAGSRKRTTAIRNRRELRPQRPEHRAREDREAGRHRNPKDFRNEIVNFVLRARASNNGRNPTWNSYEKLREVIEKKMFSNTEDLLPVVSFNAKASADDKEKHQNFVARMVAKGYTEKQVRLLAEWYLRVHKAS
jgi:serine protein kinase